MPQIVLRFIRTRGPITAAICWVTGSLWDHVEMGWQEDGVIVGWVGAHSGTGVQCRPLDYCKPVEERQYAIPVSESEVSAWRRAVKRQIGTRYNYLDILGLLVRNRKWSSPHRLICSQFCLVMLQEAGLPMLNTLPQFSFLVTPEMLHLSPVLRGQCIYHKGAK